MLLLVALLQTALAQPVSGVPPGANAVGLLMCPNTLSCERQSAWLSSAKALPEPFLLAESFVSEQQGRWERAAVEAGEVVKRVELAKRRLAEGKPEQAATALDDAVWRLERWPCPVENQVLFDLHYLRAAAAQARGRSLGSSLTEAAAVAWNRQPELPVADEALQAAWYAAQERLLGEGVMTLQLAALTGALSWHLDGIDLGSGPFEVQVMEGRHQLLVVHENGLPAWERTVLAHGGRKLRVEARLPTEQEEESVLAALVASANGAPLTRDVEELLADWSRRNALSRVRLVAVYLDGEDWRVEQVVYDADKRRVLVP